MGEILTGIFCQRWNNEGYLCQRISIIQNLLLPIEHRTACVLKGRSFLYNKRAKIKTIESLIKVIPNMQGYSCHTTKYICFAESSSDQHTIKTLWDRLRVSKVPVCCKSLLSEEELIDQLVSRCPVQPGCRRKSTGQPKDSRNSRKWGWTLEEDSTFFRIWWMQKMTQHSNGIFKNVVFLILSGFYFWSLHTSWLLFCPALI